MISQNNPESLWECAMDDVFLDTSATSALLDKARQLATEFPSTDQADRIRIALREQCVSLNLLLQLVSELENLQINLKTMPSYPLGGMMKVSEPYPRSDLSRKVEEIIDRISQECIKAAAKKAGQTIDEYMAYLRETLSRGMLLH